MASRRQAWTRPNSSISVNVSRSKSKCCDTPWRVIESSPHFKLGVYGSRWDVRIRDVVKKGQIILKPDNYAEKRLTHLALVYNGSESRLFVDGVLAATQAGKLERVFINPIRQLSG